MKTETYNLILNTTLLIFFSTIKIIKTPTRKTSSKSTYKLSFKTKAIYRKKLKDVICAKGKFKAKKYCDAAQDVKKTINELMHLLKELSREYNKIHLQHQKERMYLAQLEIELANCEPKERWKSVPYPPFAILVDDDSHCKKFRSKVKAFSKHVILSQINSNLLKRKSFR